MGTLQVARARPKATQPTQAVKRARADRPFLAC